MNDCVFISISVPQPHHRDIHSPPQVSSGCTGILGPDPESSGEGGGLCCPILSLTTTMVSGLHTQRDVVWLSESPRASALHFGVCEGLLELCTEAAVS